MPCYEEVSVPVSMGEEKRQTLLATPCAVLDYGEPNEALVLSE